MAQRLCRGERADHGDPVVARGLEERRHRRTGGPDGDVGHPLHAADEHEVPWADLPGRPRAQPARPPGRDDRERADQRPSDIARQSIGDREAEEAAGKQQHRVGADDAAIDGTSVPPGSRGVRRQLHRSVHRDGHHRVEDEQHHQQQHHPAAETGDGGHRRRGHCGEHDDRGVERVEVADDGRGDRRCVDETEHVAYMYQSTNAHRKPHVPWSATTAESEMLDPQVPERSDDAALGRRAAHH